MERNEIGTYKFNMMLKISQKKEWLSICFKIDLFGSKEMKSGAAKPKRTEVALEPIWDLSAISLTNYKTYKIFANVIYSKWERIGV